MPGLERGWHSPTGKDHDARVAERCHGKAKTVAILHHLPNYVPDDPEVLAALAALDSGPGETMNNWMAAQVVLECLADQMRQLPDEFSQYRLKKQMLRYLSVAGGLA